MNAPFLISADSHVVETPDIWTSRMPVRFKDRAPRQERMEQGDAWVIPGTPPFPFGLIQCGGLPPQEYRLWIRWDEVRQEASEPAARIAGQEKAGVQAEVLYPSPRIAVALHGADGDLEYHVAAIRAYNDWLSEYCA
ncbi:MAG: hypothetical protein JWM91_3026, partial [Rhodospirillales bacterium]|nr:hypothetical protein [Rhodospirillales bacterium]